MFTAQGFVEIIAAATMIVGIFTILYTRRNKGIGLRVIQFSGVVFVLPIILILALEAKIPTDVTGTILGAVVGYILSGIHQDNANQD